MEHEKKDQEAQPPSSQPPLLEYGCEPWKFTTQRVADLYETGTKLWTKDDLADIERQLEQSVDHGRFTLKTIEGNEIHVKNPGFGVQRPIWKPYVKYRDYWKLIHSQSEIPPELYYSSYIIDWRNTSLANYRRRIENWTELFETRRQLWNASVTCQSLKLQLKQLLKAKKVTKVICFALGDFSSTLYSSESSTEEKKSKGKGSHNPMIQHAMALTLAEELRQYNPSVRLITQDPWYGDDTASFLSQTGFEIKGRFGAGAFAEVDEQSVIISAFAPIPIVQILADIARPALFITTTPGMWVSTVNCVDSKFLNPESPRTDQMWQEYDEVPFPLCPVEAELMNGGFEDMALFARKDAISNGQCIQVSGKRE